MPDFIQIENNIIRLDSIDYITKIKNKIIIMFKQDNLEFTYPEEQAIRMYDMILNTLDCKVIK